MTAQQQQELGELAHSEGGTVVALLRQIEQDSNHTPISASTAVRYLKEMDFTYKHYRYSLKKAKSRGVRARQQSDWVLAQLDHERQCELLYFNESGFSPNPPVQYGWGRIGQTRSVAPLAHRQRVNVLGHYATTVS